MPVHVLVMDDESIVRSVSAVMLRELGYAAHTAKNGEEALQLYQTSLTAGKPFDVLILDLAVRGGMGGLETMKRLLELNPGVTAILSTGHQEDPSVANHQSYGFKACLTKPYELSELQAALNLALQNEDMADSNEQLLAGENMHLRDCPGMTTPMMSIPDRDGSPPMPVKPSS